MRQVMSNEKDGREDENRCRGAPQSGAVYLVSCAKDKRHNPCKAKDLYKSALFWATRRYVEAKGRPWFILSAKYGLAGPEDVIEPYEKTLNNMRAQERRGWAAPVLEKLLALNARRFVFLAGARYFENLAGPLERAGHEVDLPMKRLIIGKRKPWLENCCATRARDD